jgi:hypothetical protein
MYEGRNPDGFEPERGVLAPFSRCAFLAGLKSVLTHFDDTDRSFRLTAAPFAIVGSLR